MDRNVEKLLEGRSDEEKFQAIAFSFRCLLTRPTTNSNRDTPKKDELRAKERLNREPKYSLEESSDEEDDDVLGKLQELIDELRAKVKLKCESKYSFEKWSDEEDDNVSAAKQSVFQTNSAKGNLGRKVSAPGNVIQDSHLKWSGISSNSDSNSQECNPTP